MSLSQTPSYMQGGSTYGGAYSGLDAREMTHGSIDHNYR